jgi:hypothetical protein
MNLFFTLDGLEKGRGLNFFIAELIILSLILQPSLAIRLIEYLVKHHLEQ